MLFFEFKDKEKKIEYHLADLKKYLIFACVIFFTIFFINFYFAKDLVFLFQRSLVKVLHSYNLLGNPFIVTSLPEAFISYIKFTFFISILVFMPFLLLQISIYLRHVLNKSIKKEVIIVISILAPCLFYLGVIVAYFVTFHIIWNFLVKFSLSKNLDLYLKISEYIQLSLQIIFWSGVIFELPVIIYLLFRLGIISYKSLKKFRKIAILLAFIIAAIITPPDPFSQIIMAVILIVLYEITLIVIKSINK